MGTTKDSEKTQAKIIEAAGPLFAERGFKGVTVRDIAKKANTQVSALNYHFRSKEALYRKVLLKACRSNTLSEKDKKQLSRLDPRKALFLIVQEALKEYGKQLASNWEIVIVNRECRESGRMFEKIVEEYFKPVTDFISGIIGKITNQSPDSPHVRFAALGLFGLLETFGLYGHLIDATAPGLKDHFKKKDRFAKQIVHITIEAASSNE